MDRRAFMTSIGAGTLAAPFVASAQGPTKVWRIGLLIPGIPPTCASDQPPSAFALRQGLRDLGYVESQNYVLVVRCVLRDTQAASAARELVASDLDAIIVASNELARAVKKVTTAVPVVFVAVTDPELEGLVASLARPGGNMTGLSHMTAELAGKRLELLRGTLPKVRKVAILSVDRHPYIATEASRLGMEAQMFLAEKPDALEGAFAEIRRVGADGLLVDAHPMFWIERELIVKHVARLKLPAIYESRDYVVAGGLMAYGASLADMSRRTASYVDRILKGTKPADLPVEQPTKFELVINLKTAKALGLTIPPSLLLRADEVIQ
jgi:putative ABC transport system substrate-binding protein